jgi:ketosteroid isomerase-like protein
VGRVEEYLKAVVAQDWDALTACLAPDIERVGPFGDTYRGTDDYVAFLRDLMPRLPGYSMHVERVTYDAATRAATAELSETVEVGGQSHVTPEALVFDLDAAGLIRRIAIYIQRLDEEARTP